MDIWMRSAPGGKAVSYTHLDFIYIFFFCSANMKLCIHLCLILSCDSLRGCHDRIMAVPQNTHTPAHGDVYKRQVILLLFSPHLLWLPHFHHLSFVHFTMFSSIFYPSLVLFNQLYETYYRNSHVKCQYCLICFTFVS